MGTCGVLVVRVALLVGTTLHLSAQDVPAAQAAQAAQAAPDQQVAQVAQLAPGAPAESRALRIELGPEGPASGACVLPFRGQVALTASRCDEAGRVTLADADGVDSLVLFGPPAIACVVPLAPDATDVSVPLIRLAGRVLVDGEAPRGPMSLGLAPLTGMARLSGEMLRTFGKELVENLRTTTDAQGRFDFGLVSTSLSGRIEGPRDLVSMAQDGARGRADNMVAFEHAGAELVLEFHALPCLIGRVVDARGEAVPGARYELHTVYDSRWSSGTSGSVDAAGGLRIPLYDEAMKEGVLQLSGPPGSGRRTLSLKKSVGDVNLGDIVLEPYAVLPVAVRDTEGRPIVGAIVYSPTGSARSDPSDSEGRILFTGVVDSEPQVRVAALGFQSMDVPSHAASKLPVDVVLQRLATLAIDVRAADGTPAEKLQLRLECDMPLFVDPAAGFDRPLQERLGANSVRGCTGTSGCCFASVYFCGGRALLTGLRDGVTIRASLTDRCGTELRPTESIVVTDRAQLTRSWQLSRSPRDVTVLVRAPDGSPVPNAPVAPACVDAVLNDREGRALLHDVFGDELSFEVRPPPASGLGRTEKLTRSIPPDGLIVVDVVPARTLVIEVVEEDGTPVDATVRLDGFGSFIVDGRRTGPGRYEAGGYGEGDVRITVSDGQRADARLHDTAVPVARFVLPTVH